MELSGVVFKLGPDRGRPRVGTGGGPVPVLHIPQPLTLSDQEGPPTTRATVSLEPHQIHSTVTGLCSWAVDGPHMGLLCHFLLVPLLSACPCTDVGGAMDWQTEPVKQ